MRACASWLAHRWVQHARAHITSQQSGSGTMRVRLCANRYARKTLSTGTDDMIERRLTAKQTNRHYTYCIFRSKNVHMISNCRRTRALAESLAKFIPFNFRSSVKSANRISIDVFSALRQFFIRKFCIILLVARPSIHWRCAAPSIAFEQNFGYFFFFFKFAMMRWCVPLCWCVLRT